MKRKYALAAVLVGTLVLPLFGCQKNAGENLNFGMGVLEKTMERHGTGRIITMLFCYGTSQPLLQRLCRRIFWCRLYCESPCFSRGLA